MRRILIINPFGIGDVIFSMTLVEAIRRANPEAMIGFLCNERSIDLVRLNASIDQTFVFHRDLWNALWKKNPLLFFRKLGALLSLIKTHEFDTVFDLSLGREYSFFCWWIGIKRRIGFNYKGRGIFLSEKMPFHGYEGRFVADIQMDLLEKVGIPCERGKAILPIQIPLAVRSEANELLRKEGINGGVSMIALAPGGGRSWGANAVYKQWDSERFAEAMNRFSAHRRVFVLLLGDRSEQGLLEETAALLRAPRLVMAGEAIEKVCALLQRVDFLCCNDSGLLHLANALGVKTVSLFGPVDEKVYGPYGNETTHEVLMESVPCRPCYKKFHFPPCPHARRCLKDLSVDQVLAAMNKVASSHAG